MGQVMVRPLAKIYWLLVEEDMLRDVESWLSGWLLLRTVSDLMMAPKPSWVL